MVKYVSMATTVLFLSDSAAAAIFHHLKLLNSKLLKFISSFIPLACSLLLIWEQQNLQRIESIKKLKQTFCVF